MNKDIKFLDISHILLKILKNVEFMKYKNIKPQNINEIIRLSEYVRLKIRSLHI
jgi:1-deoxy-D-xylulose 5-phosphate reductoisomerase